MKRSQKRGDMISFPFFENEAGSIVLDALKKMDGGVREANEKGVAIIQSGNYKRND